ncbi:MAG: division/cell wall cluster transcriptional repressor MraZ [Actinomycetota bacterium]|nr:division/cell wall cluster transcriptional repressor MraZ [Actinomycetota bacterium]MDI6821729.1 division/cell wall cluster transcriptional repressor MraZ [Actinomycetota bacterium]
MFSGEFHHTLDSTGRLILPAEFRDALADGLFIAKGMEKCLFIFSRKEWLQLADKIRLLPLTKKDARQFSRCFFSGAKEGILDKQGRVLIPDHLRKYAGLNKDVVIIGVSNRLEIWNREKWETYRKQAEKSYAEVAEHLPEFSI